MNIRPKGSRETPGASEVAQWPLERLLAYVQTNSLPEAAGWMRQQKVVADRFKVRLIAYEAGQHLVGVGGGGGNAEGRMIEAGMKEVEFITIMTFESLGASVNLAHALEKFCCFGLEVSIPLTVTNCAFLRSGKRNL